MSEILQFLGTVFCAYIIWVILSLLFTIYTYFKIKSKD